MMTDQAPSLRAGAIEVETRNFKGPRNYEDSGLPLHFDNQSIIKERLFLDKGNPDIYAQRDHHL